MVFLYLWLLGIWVCSIDTISLLYTQIKHPNLSKPKVPKWWNYDVKLFSFPSIWFLYTCCLKEFDFLGVILQWACTYWDMPMWTFDSLQIYVCRWWMGHYHGKTPKRHICWSNTPKIGRLDKGVLTKHQREEIRKMGVKSATTKVNKKGGKSYSGTSALRGTGFGSQLFLPLYHF